MSPSDKPSFGQFDFRFWVSGGGAWILRDPSVANPARASRLIEYAFLDLEAKQPERAGINAVSNAKRALDSCVNSFMDAIGLKHGGKKMPQKLQICEDCGILPSRIFRKLVRLRNEVEHEGYSPSTDEAEDFVDVVALLIYATDLYFRIIPKETNLWRPDFTLPDEDYIERVRIERENSSTVVQIKWWKPQFPPVEMVRRAKATIFTADPDTDESKFEFDARVSAAIRRELTSELTWEIATREREEYCHWVGLLVRRCFS